MPTLLRITLLSVFAAAGVGVAIAIAMQPPDEAPHPHTARHERKPRPASVHPAEQPDRPAVAVEELPAPAPHPASYRPAIANQVNAMADTLERIEQAAAARQGAVEETLSQLRDIVQSPRGGARACRQ